MSLALVYTMGVAAPAYAAKKPAAKAKAAAKKPEPKKPEPAPGPAAEPTGTVAPAEEAKPTPVAAPTPPPAAAPSATKIEKPAASDLDFDLLDKPAQAALDPEAAARLDAMVGTRRTLLKVHLALGIALVVASTANTVLGTLNYYDKYGGGGYKDTYKYPHLISSMSTTAIFATQGILALAAPEPYERDGGWDTARVHRILEIAATVGMVTQIVLGFVTAYAPGLKGTITERDLARVHLGVGFATWAFTNAGAAAYLF